MAKIIGIDLGTTTSLVSYLKNGKPEIIPNKLGKRLTDSVVGVDKYGTIIVGEEAKRILNGTKIEEIKRSMGTNKIVKLEEIFKLILEKSNQITFIYIFKPVTFRITNNLLLLAHVRLN